MTSPHPLTVEARKRCGCYNCLGGPRDLGAHTIAMPDNPRSTPTSCLAGEWLRILYEEQSKVEVVMPESLRKQLDSEEG